MKSAVELALASERAGNIPVGAVITLGGEVIAQGCSEVLKPTYHPGRHAEIVALGGIDEALWPRAREMTCYTTLEPCVMCAGAMLLHGIGRVVFGAVDVLGGAGCVLGHLPPYYDQGGVYDWEGPLMPEVCDPLYERADEAFAGLPVGRDQWIAAEPQAHHSPPATVDTYLEELSQWRESGAPASKVRRAREAVAEFARIVDGEQIGDVLPYARAIFETTGYLKDFRSLERYARQAGSVDIFQEVDEALRRHLPDIWILKALGRDDIDAAVACWFENEDHARARLCADELVRAAADDEVELLISCRLSTVNYRIRRGSRRHYRRACAVLRRLRDELEEAGEPDYWEVVLEDIQHRYASRPALINELERAGFLG